MKKFMIGLAVLSIAAGAKAQISGTVEAYGRSDNAIKGQGHQLSWWEVHGRTSPYLVSTLSFTRTPTYDAWDEACVAYQPNFNIYRAGRIRTAFGFSNWSDLFYTGFNHSPLLNFSPLVNGLILTRDDTGFEITTGSAQDQLQLSAIDTKSNTYQVVPKKIRATTLRYQRPVKSLLVGINALANTSGSQGIFGIDVRYSFPSAFVRGAWMTGFGPGKIGSGYWWDASFRPFHLEKTQLVVRDEQVKTLTGLQYHLETAGVKHVFCRYFSANVNYGWGNGDERVIAYSYGAKGWSLRTMFQVTF